MTRILHINAGGLDEPPAEPGGIGGRKQLAELVARTDGSGCGSSAMRTTARRWTARLISPGYEPDLGIGLHNLGILLAQLGHAEEALSVAQEASEIYRRLEA